MDFVMLMLITAFTASLFGLLKILERKEAP